MRDTLQLWGLTDPTTLSIVLCGILAGVILPRVWPLHVKSDSSSQPTGAAAFLVENQVSHARLLPRDARHGFGYTIIQYLLSINALESGKLDRARGWVFGYGGTAFRVTGLRPAAYLVASGSEDASIKQRLKRLLKETTHDDALDDAWMLTMPSYLGFEGINPLTVYFCYRDGKSRSPWAIILEVHNTFGERHAYVLQCGAGEDTVPAKGFKHQWTFPRKFHVSPFNDRRGSYRVAVTPPPFSPSIAAQDLRGNLEQFKQMQIQIHFLTPQSAEPHTDPSADVEVKLMASMRPSAVVPLSSLAILRALIKHPLILFLTTLRISYHAYILHYKKLLPVYPKPDPVPVAFRVPEDGARAETHTESIGLGWQPPASAEKFAQEYIEGFLRRRAIEASVSVTLISGNPVTPQSHFAASSEGILGGTMDLLTISYLSPAFFTTLLECPSARHALLLGRTSSAALFTVSSAALFLRVFDHTVIPEVRSNAGAANVAPSGIEAKSQLSLAQRLRMRALPSQLRIRAHPQLPIPDQHPIDPSTGSSISETLRYARVLAFLLGSALNGWVERRLYGLFRVRFVEGQEPWRKWQRLSECITASIALDIDE